MIFTNNVGRPTVMTIRTMLKLTDALKNNYNVTDACKWAGISRDTYYRHLNNDIGFAARVNYAIECRDKVSFDFRTLSELNQ